LTCKILNKKNKRKTKTRLAVGFLFEWKKKKKQGFSAARKHDKTAFEDC
jgi:hypothetical protein